jgi:hypothetical protein
MKKRVTEIQEIFAASQQELLELMDVMHNRGWEEMGKQHANIETDPATGEKRMVYSLTVVRYSYDS